MGLQRSFWLAKTCLSPLQFVYCQVCCEPFHKFCLEESERPLEDQLENWCCRRCKFCHVCGRQHQATKVPPKHREKTHWGNGETPLQSPPCSFLRFRSGASRRKQSARVRASLRSAPMPSPLFLQQLLECNKCRNSYHPECLGPNYPTKPTKKKKVWVRHCDLFSVLHLTDGNAAGQSAAGGCL